MKRKFIICITAILGSVLLFSGCGFGSFIEKGKPSSPSTDPNVPVNPTPGPDDPPATPDTHYTVTLYNGTQPYLPGEEEITVVWKNDYSVHRVLLGEDGKADAGELDGDYAIYLEGLPASFTYNPGAYSATSEERNVSILLNTLRQPESGGGSGLYACYHLRYEGVYRTRVTSSSRVLYYEYSPEAPGVYSVVSWVNAYENEVNPYVNVYNGTIGFKWFDRKVDGGGFSLEGGYTKNFRQEYAVDRSEVGNSFTFAIGAETKSGNYPVNVDFAITYEGDYTSPNADVRVIHAEEAMVKADNKKPGQQFYYANQLSASGLKASNDPLYKNFDASVVKYNENTGFYHYYSEALYGEDPFGYGKNFGPILCCALTARLPSYTETPLYNANAAGLGGGSNYLRLYNVWIEEEQKYAVFDYTSFIRDDYYKVTNSEGMCYVTKEIKEFLQMYAERQSFWTDGVCPQDGKPEALGYTALQDALWLFACGVYFPA